MGKNRERAYGGAENGEKSRRVGGLKFPWNSSSDLRFEAFLITAHNWNSISNHVGVTT